MENEKYCNEFYELLKKLKPNTIIYKTNRGNNFYFIEFRDGKLFFSIPNHNNPIKPNIKSILVEKFCKLLAKLLKEGILTREDFPFQDCRKSAFYGFINILYPNTFFKTRGIIELITKK